MKETQKGKVWGAGAVCGASVISLDIPPSQHIPKFQVFMEVSHIGMIKSLAMD